MWASVHDLNPCMTVPNVKEILLARLKKLSESRSSSSSAPGTHPKEGRSHALGKRPRPSNAEPPTHAFDVDQDDHCETSGEAYDDIVPLLHELAGMLGRDLTIYDPYYCAGAVVRHLRARGFSKVYNRNEDFYRVQREHRVPYFDVVVTNPPYSGDHIERMLDFCVASKKPFFCLVPNYVYTRPKYEKLLGGNRLFFVLPSKRYEYVTPSGFRKASAREKKTSPFISFWFCHGVEHSAELIKAWRKAERVSKDQMPDAMLVQSLRQLPQRCRATYDPSRRRLRRKQRIAMKKRASKPMPMP